MYLRGLIMARGGYTFDQIRQMSSIELMFLYHYQELAIKEQQQYLTNILGVIWDKKTLMEQSVAEQGPEGSKPVEELFIPLSLAINPEVLDFVKGQFGIRKDGKSNKGKDNTGSKVPFVGGGDYIPKKNEVITSMGDMSKEDFMKLIGRKSITSK